MEKSIFLFIWFLLFISLLETVLSKDEVKENTHFHHRNKLQTSSRLRNGSSKLRSKKFAEKCLPQRCTLICPIQVQPLPVSAVPPPRPTTGIVPNLWNGLDGINQYIDRGFPDLFGEDRAKEHSKHERIRLTKRQKRILLKQLKLGNRNGQKSYKFREFSPSGCYVTCDDYQRAPAGDSPAGQPVPSDTAVQQGSTSGEEDGEDDEDDEDEPYHEGEDKPVEVTISPPDKRSHGLENEDIYNDSEMPGIIMTDKRKGRAKSHQYRQKN